MEFYDISEQESVSPGEMLLYSPRNTIVVFAAIVDDKVHAFDRGAFLEDELDKFKKIKMTHREYKEKTRNKCKGCAGGRATTRSSTMPESNTKSIKTAAGCKGCGGKK